METMTEQGAIRTKVRGFVEDNFMLGNDGGLGDDESMLERGIIDSTGVLELVNFIEETFRVSVADEDLVPDNLDSLNKLTSYIERKMTYAAQ